MMNEDKWLVIKFYCDGSTRWLARRCNRQLLQRLQNIDKEIRERALALAANQLVYYIQGKWVIIEKPIDAPNHQDIFISEHIVDLCNSYISESYPMVRCSIQHNYSYSFEWLDASGLYVVVNEPTFEQVITMVGDAIREHNEQEELQGELQEELLAEDLATGSIKAYRLSTEEVNEAKEILKRLFLNNKEAARKLTSIFYGNRSGSSLSEKKDRGES